MNWFYVSAGQQAGPVDDTQFAELVRAGHVQPDTLVWHEGMAGWQPYRNVAEPGATPANPGTPTPALTAGDEAVCVECRGIFKKADMIQYGTVSVCSGCKPIFMQKLAEGVQVGTASGRRALPVNADELIREIDARDYDIRIGEFISKGWALVKSNFWLCVGATFLVLLCTQAAGFIPILGVIATLILQGPLIGGLYLFYIKLLRGESNGLGDAFSGFSEGFWRLCGTMLLMMILLYLPITPGLVVLFINLSKTGSISTLAWALLVPGIIGMMYIGVAFSFSIPLAADLHLGPWDSLRVSFRAVSKHWFAVFGLLFVGGLVAGLGVFALCIGILVTLPIFYAATMYAYEEIFGLR